MSLTKQKPKTEESRIEEYAIHFADSANFVIFEIIVLLQGLVFYGIGVSIAWIFGY